MGAEYELTAGFPHTGQCSVRSHALRNRPVRIEREASANFTLACFHANAGTGSFLAIEPITPRRQLHRRAFDSSSGVMNEVFLGSVDGGLRCDHLYTLVIDSIGIHHVRKVTIFEQAYTSPSIQEITPAEYSSHEVNGERLDQLVTRSLPECPS